MDFTAIFFDQNILRVAAIGLKPEKSGITGPTP